MSKKQKSTLLYGQGQNLLGGGNTLPIKVMTQHDIKTGKINEINRKENSAKEKKKILVFSKGVEAISQDDYIVIRSAPLFFRMFLVFFVFSLFLFALVVWLLQENKSLKHQVPKKSEVVIKEKQEEVKPEEKESKKTNLNNTIPKKIIKIAKNQPKKSWQFYESPVKLYKLVSNEKAALDILEEVEIIRHEALKFTNRDKRKKFLKQAVYRCQALIRKGKISNYYRRLATYRLWVIYKCDLSWDKAAKAVGNILRKYNRSAKGTTFKRVCPVE